MRSWGSNDSREGVLVSSTRKGCWFIVIPLLKQRGRNAIGLSSIRNLKTYSKGKRLPQQFMPLSKERNGWSASPLFPPSAGLLRPAKEKMKSPPNLDGYFKKWVFFYASSMLAFLLALTLSRTIASPIAALRNFALALGGGEEKRQPLPARFRNSRTWRIRLTHGRKGAGA